MNEGTAAAPILLPLTPENFWSLFKDEIKEIGSWRAYQSDALWTPIALAAGESACRRFGFQTGREYFRLDVCAWTGSDYDYDLRVAFENENAETWEDELCKLAHIVSDLRVLVAYHLNVSLRPEDQLDQYLVRHHDRVLRDCKCKWLFIFGPHYTKARRNDCWTAYTLDESGKRVLLPDEVPFLGTDMKD